MFLKQDKSIAHEKRGHLRPILLHSPIKKGNHNGLTILHFKSITQGKAKTLDPGA